MKSNPFKRRREELDLTQRQIADSFTPRLASVTVSMWERGINSPRRCLIDDLCRVYQQPREWVLAACAHVRKSRPLMLARPVRRQMGRPPMRRESELAAAK